jgi:replicative DNA helicase
MQTDREESKKRIEQILQNQTSMGKLPPQALELEEALLGSILLNKESFLAASEIIKSECFYKDSNQKIFKACENMFNKSQPIDLLTVPVELRLMGDLESVGGVYALVELTSRVSRAVDVEFCSKIIYQKFLQREMIRIGSETINQAYEDTTDVFELIEKNQSDVFGLAIVGNKKEIYGIDSLVTDCIDYLKTPSIDGLTGIGTGFKDVDKITGGWQNSDLIIIAARPAMGKTAFVLNVAKNACLQYNVPTLFFSLEMSAKQLTHRIVADESNVMYERIKRKTLSFHEVDVLQNDIKKLSQSKLFIDDTPTLNPYDFRVKARRMKQKHGIGLIVIDYLQLMEGGIKSKSNGNREQEISQISRSLKQVAKELDIPVIALSQLSRAVESRQGSSKRPQLSDLRESGSIEQDADMVGFLYRPEYYGIMEDAEGKSTTGLCELIFQKNRAGVCDTVKLDFNGAYMRFKDWSEGYVPSSKFKSLVEPKNSNSDEDRPF